jgi:acetate kinase
LDAFVFTVEISENSPKIRARIAEKLGWLGVSLDPPAATGAAVISPPRSRVAVYVILTDEELMLARHTGALLTDSP